jgi:isopenicillin N synthase-like dioxygenase
MLPLIDIAPLLQSDQNKSEVIDQIGQACREMGFFYVVGHGVDERLQRQLERVSRQFFDQPAEKKLQISMDKGGRAWRGYFLPETELTSGKPDLKEGLYFSEDLPPDHPLVKAGIPLLGPNLYPEIPGFGKIVMGYFQQLSALSETLMKAIALSLKLPEDFFRKHYMTNPIQLFRIFHYPPPTAKQIASGQWGVGEHTDYGMLTVLKQDATGGLQVYSREQWIEAPYVPNSFVCNLGDMLDYLTGGHYRSTPHRVSHTAVSGRLSFPFFYDLDRNATPSPIDLNHLGHIAVTAYNRWDHSSLHSFSGTYGDYLMQKISKVFPQLRDKYL